VRFRSEHNCGNRPLREPQHDPLRFVGLDVGDVEPDEFGAAKRADEPHEQQCPIAEVNEPDRPESREQLAQRISDERGFVGLLPAEGLARWRRPACVRPGPLLPPPGGIGRSATSTFPASATSGAFKLTATIAV
jgi:hypothetical protein